VHLNIYRRVTDKPYNVVRVHLTIYMRKSLTNLKVLYRVHLTIYMRKSPTNLIML
jgi:hypothetical protein